MRESQTILYAIGSNTPRIQDLHVSVDCAAVQLERVGRRGPFSSRPCSARLSVMPSVDDTQVFATFPSASTSFLPTSTSAAASSNSVVANSTEMPSTADLDALKRKFEGVNIVGTGSPAHSKNASLNGAALGASDTAVQGGIVPPRHSHGPPYGSPAAAAKAFDQMNGGSATLGLFAPGPRAPLADQLNDNTSIPRQQGHHNGNVNGPMQGYAHPTSPFLTVGDGFGSPVSQNGMLPGQVSYPASNYEFDPTLSMPSSPNPYAPPFAPGFSGLGFTGAPSSPFMMSPMLGMGAMGGLDAMQLAAAAAAAQNYSMGFSPMMGSPDFGMSASAQTVSATRMYATRVYLL